MGKHPLLQSKQKAKAHRCAYENYGIHEQRFLSAFVHPHGDVGTSAFTGCSAGFSILVLDLGSGDDPAGMSIPLWGLQGVARKLLPVFSSLKDKLQREMMNPIPR